MTARSLETGSRTVLATLRAPVSMPAPPVDAEQRAQSVVELGELIRAVPARRAAHRARRRQLMWASTSSAAAAIALAVAAGAYWFGAARVAVAPPPAALDSGSTLVAGNLVTAEGRVLAPGQRFAGAGALRAPDEQSALVLTQAGVQLTFAPGSRATVPAVHEDQRFHLDEGQLSLDVPPMPAGRTLTVVTSDATVVVHGTRFSVAYDAQAAPPTCVRVTEGRVSVVRRRASEEVLLAGDSSGCGERTPLSPPPAVSPSAARPSQSPPSTLAQQNHLFLQALAAEQAGNHARAERDLERLLARYPDSPFQAEARRALARVRARHDAP